MDVVRNKPFITTLARVLGKGQVLLVSAVHRRKENQGKQWGRVKREKQRREKSKGVSG